MNLGVIFKINFEVELVGLFVYELVYIVLFYGFKLMFEGNLINSVV